MYKIFMEKSSEMLIYSTQHALRREVGCEDRRWVEFTEVPDQGEALEPCRYSTVLVSSVAYENLMLIIKRDNV
jgi:hypothetical protein